MAEWNIWYDVDGMNEVVLALTPLKNTNDAEKKRNRIIDNERKIKALENLRDNPEPISPEQVIEKIMEIIGEP